MERLLLSLVVAAACCSGQESPGNFDIRCDATAKLQTKADIPLQIQVFDARHQPLANATVVVRIETQDHHDRQATFKAPAVNPGVYLAKPMFPVPGTWEVNVEVRRNQAVNARTFEYNVPQ